MAGRFPVLNQVIREGPTKKMHLSKDLEEVRDWRECFSRERADSKHRGPGGVVCAEHHARRLMLIFNLLITAL